METEMIFFNNWISIFRTLIIGVMAYAAMVILLRISGKRTLSKMNAFDFIVTVALGSTLAAVITNKNIALAEGVLAFALLIFLQYIITWLSYRSKTVIKIVKSEPALLFYKGDFLRDKMKKERVTEEEIIASVRQNGIGDFSDLEAIVIETDGSLSILKKTGGNSSSLYNLSQRHEL